MTFVQFFHQVLVLSSEFSRSIIFIYLLSAGRTINPLEAAAPDVWKKNTVMEGKKIVRSISWSVRILHCILVTKGMGVHQKGSAYFNKVLNGRKSFFRNEQESIQTVQEIPSLLCNLRAHYVWRGSSSIRFTLSHLIPVRFIIKRNVAISAPCNKPRRPKWGVEV